MNNKLPNIYEYDRLERGIFVVLKKDYIFIKDLDDQDASNTENSFEDFPKNIYRGQLGLCYGPTTDGSDTYTVLFQDRDADPISFADGINELEVKKDDVISLLLLHPDNPQLHLFTRCYSNQHYKKLTNVDDKKTSLKSFIVELPQPEIEKTNENQIEKSQSGDMSQDSLVNEDQYSEFDEKSDDPNTASTYEMVLCYDTNLFIQHNETENQFEPDSLVTVQDVCRGVIDNTFYLYPGQVGKIIKPYPLMDTNQPFSSEDYLEVIFLPFTLSEWNEVSVYYAARIQRKDGTFRIDELKKENCGVIVYINKYNLVPIFQTELTLTETGKMQIQEIQKFSTLMEKCTSEEYRDQLQKQCERMNVANEDYEEQLKLFENLKLFFSK